MGHIVNSYRFGSALTYTPLGDVVASCVFDLDATIAASYSTGQQWVNLEPSPADGQAQSFYSMYLGATASVAADDPTFNGTAGSAAAYWSCAGAQFFAHPAGTSPGAFLGYMHQESTADPWSMVFAFRYKSDASSKVIAGSSNGTSARGWRLQIGSSGQVQMIRATGAATATDTILPNGSLVDGTDYLLAITWDPVSRAYKGSLNGATFTATGTGTTIASNTAISNQTFSILSANKSTSLGMVTGTRLYACSAYNAILSDANLAAIAAAYEARHSRDYTP